MPTAQRRGISRDLLDAGRPELDKISNPSTMARMTAAEQIAPTITEQLTWAEICRRHPDEWVCLVEVQHEHDGPIRSARLVGHHRSMKEALKQFDSWSTDPVVAYAHTGGRKLRSRPC